MADTQKILISLANLTEFKTKIVNYIDTEDAKSLRSMNIDAEAHKVYFYRTTDASDPVAYTLDLSDIYTDLATIKGEGEGSIKKAVKDLEDTLADIATSGKAEDVTIEDKDNKITATNVEDALIELADAISGIDGDFGDLADVATSGAAADVAITDADNVFTAENVEDALTEVKKIADANKSAIEALDIEGDIESAINDLKYEDTAVAGQFVTAVSEEDGVITVSRAALVANDIPTLTLEKISDAGTVASKNVATVAIGGEGEVTSAIPTVDQVKVYIANQVAGLTGTVHFVGVVQPNREAGQTDEEALVEAFGSPVAPEGQKKPSNGDMAIIEDTGDQYIFSTEDVIMTGRAIGTWKKIGNQQNYALKSTTIAGVDLQDNITKDELLTALNVADGAQVNVLEGVQVNGTDLAITDKKVNVTIAEGATNGTVAVNGTDVSVHGLGTAAYTAADAYDEAGAADAVLGTAEDDENAMTVYGARAYAASLVGAGYREATTTEIDELFK